MASTQDLKRRISTIRNTQQTTRAMKMVSAAKLRRAQDAIYSNRPYSRRVGKLIRQISLKSELIGLSPLIQKSQEDKKDRPRKTLLILVSSDRGLCGGFNANIIRHTQKWVDENLSGKHEIHLGFIGRKAHDYFKNRVPDRIQYYEEYGNNADLEKALKVKDWAVDQYLAGNFDEIRFVYNEFKNAISQDVVAEIFLPLHPEELPEATADDAAEVDKYIIKPSASEVLKSLLERHFGIQAYRIFLESQASEHGARMSSMDNATRNAGEVIKKLTLQFNKQRQAGITRELLEIISGAESQKNG